MKIRPRSGSFPPFPPPPGGGTAYLAVDKTNDANGDGTFTDAETALTSGRTVPFRIVVTNNSTPMITVQILSVTDANIPNLATLMAAQCPGFINKVLQPGESATCTVTVIGYSPPYNTSKTNTLRVDGNACGPFVPPTSSCQPVSASDNSKVVTASTTSTSTSTSTTSTSTSTTSTTVPVADTSTTLAAASPTALPSTDPVAGPPSPTPQTSTQPAPPAEFEALAFTGSPHVGWQLLLGAAAVALGLLLLLLGRPRMEPELR